MRINFDLKNPRASTGTLRLGSRISDLARLQAFTVGAAIQKKFPNIKIDFNFRESLGDKNLNDPLWKMPERGVFTEDFYRGLMEDELDLVVHSWKDLPLIDRNETKVIATLPREDQRDLLLFRKDQFQSVINGRQLKILTSSPRRNYQLSKFLTDHLPFQQTNSPPLKIEFLPVRGNVPTRIKKLSEGDSHALVLAKAAWDRLTDNEIPELQTLKAQLLQQRKSLQWMVLPLSHCPTAAAQGALAIEIKSDRTDLIPLFEAINCQMTHELVQVERRILGQFGGGCHQKIGVSCLNTPGGRLTISLGESPDGKTIDKVQLEPKFLQGKEVAANFPIPKNLDAIWPRQRSDFISMKRIQIPAPKYNDSSACFVSRIEALPEEWLTPIGENLKNGADQIIWTSGTETWKKLARLGVWVNGSQENLGESIPPVKNLQHQSAESLQWTKLTHQDAATIVPENGDLKQIATYQLEEEPDWERQFNENRPVDQITHFYWNSASQFISFTKKFPQIKNRYHYCGMGNTARFLQSKVDHLQICLSYEEWLKEMQMKTSSAVGAHKNPENKK